MFRHFGRLLPQAVGRGAAHIPAGLIEHPADIPGAVKTCLWRRAAPDVGGAQVLFGFFQHGGKFRIAQRFGRHLVVDACLAGAVRTIPHRHPTKQLGPVALGLLQDVVAVQIVPDSIPRATLSIPKFSRVMFKIRTHTAPPPHRCRCRRWCGSVPVRVSVRVRISMVSVKMISYWASKIDCMVPCTSRGCRLRGWLSALRPTRGGHGVMGSRSQVYSS